MSEEARPAAAEESALSEAGYRPGESSAASVEGKAGETPALADEEEESADTETKTEKDDSLEENEKGFFNHGLARWEKSRKEWLTLNRSNPHQKPSTAKQLDVDDIIDVIFTSSRQMREQGGPRYFPQSVPLPQMVDILQDLWEAEGLDA